MATIDSVDLYYLSMPVVEDVGDGSQDVLLVRVRAGEWEGWGRVRSVAARLDRQPDRADVP